MPRAIESVLIGEGRRLRGRARDSPRFVCEGASPEFLPLRTKRLAAANRRMRYTHENGECFG